MLDDIEKAVNIVLGILLATTALKELLKDKDANLRGLAPLYIYIIA